MSIPASAPRVTKCEKCGLGRSHRLLDGGGAAALSLKGEHVGEGRVDEELPAADVLAPAAAKKVCTYASVREQE